MKGFYKIIFKKQPSENFYYWIFIRLVNIVLPVFYYLSNLFLSIKLDESNNLNSSDKYVVSLTSFPERIGYVWLTVESILRQTAKPDAIILWLAKNEFKGKESLPSSLLKLQDRGLQIRFCDDNLMPHKKYFYTMRKYPKANVITVDDDVIYSPYLIKNLKCFHHQFPGAICAPIIQKIAFDHSGLKPYSQWTHIEENTAPSFRYLPIGAGGVLYPPDSLNKDVFNKKILKQTSFGNDDLWLKMMSVRQGTRVAGLAGGYYRPCIPIYIKHDRTLMQKNVEQGQNNIMIRNLLNYYSLSPDVFEDKKRDSIKQKTG